MVTDVAKTLGLRPGEWVEVRSEPEILATLDDEGAVDGLPFMPEMVQFCRRRFRVTARADRTVVQRLGVRRMKDTVHLADLRCDGGAHDDCCRGCLLFWKECWLQRLPTSPTATPTPASSQSLRTTNEDGYVCQSSQLDRATIRRPLLHLGQELRAPAAEGLSPLVLLHSIYILAYDIAHRRLGRREWNSLSGPCTKTPTVRLGLRPGERVRVKPLPEILATLDVDGHNRGMEFSREMVAYCGCELVVLRRAERVILDQDSEMVEMQNTVLLEGAVYQALNRRAVPRREFMFWRECWLDRV
jgi:hypothetical protein